MFQCINSRFFITDNRPKNFRVKVSAVRNGKEKATSKTVVSHTEKEFNIQLENLDRGLIALSNDDGIFLSWRLLGHEVDGYSDNGMTGANFNVYRDRKKFATVNIVQILKLGIVPMMIIA
ncbi:hypothetical protein MM221_08925 [Salipaludibacillus sp. LMS25]|jgi:hypothetical protein|nr:hypothetical protein MM221_08925 [Salipaludibacillus sp. LMS25]